MTSFQATKKPHLKSAFPSFWKPLLKGSGKTILEVALHSPIEVMEAQADGLIPQKSRQQAEEILEQLRSILPPRPDPERWEFIIKLGRRGYFANFRIVRKGQSQLGPGEYRTAYLNLAPKEYYGGEDELIRLFHEHYFGGAPRRKQMVDFMLDARRFEYAPVALAARKSQPR